VVEVVGGVGVAAGLVERLLGVEHGLVGPFDVVAGGGVEPGVAGGGLQLGDHPLDLGQLVLGGAQLVLRRRHRQGLLDAGQLVLDVEPLAGQVAGHGVDVAPLGLRVEVGEGLLDRLGVEQRGLHAGHQVGPLVGQLLAQGRPLVDAGLDHLEGAGHLVVGGLGRAQLVAGLLQLPAQRVLVELGRPQLLELRPGVVDGPLGGGPLVLDHREALAGSLQLGPAPVEEALGLIRGLRELAGVVEQTVALGQVGGEAAGPRRGLVAAVGDDRLLLPRPAKLSG
jgi:hypothetical protein